MRLLKHSWIPVAAALACSEDPSFAPGQTGTLEITPINIGFGCTQIGCQSAQQVTIRNAGKGELYIRSITFDSEGSKDFSYLTDKPLPVPLRSGDQLQIEIDYQPSDQVPDAAVLIVEHNGKAAPGTRVGQREYQALVYVRGRELGIPHLVVDKEVVTYGFVAPGAEKALKVRVTNDGTGTAILALEPPAIKSGNALPFVIDELRAGDLLVNRSESKEITVRFRPATPNLFEDVLVLRSNDGEVEGPVEIKLQGTAIQGPKLLAFPASVDFGEVRKNQPDPKRVVVTFRSAGSEPVEYRGIPQPTGANQTLASQFTAKALGTIPQQLDPFAAFQAEVTFAPTQEGVALATLTVNTPNQPTTTAVELSGTGRNPILDVTCKTPVPPGMTCTNNPLAMNFGSVVEGWSTQPIGFEIRNAGTGSLHIEKIRLEPASAISFGLEGLPGFPMEVPTGVTISGKVTYGSGGLGTQLGTVGIYTYSVDAPDKTIALSATGTACETQCPLANAEPNCAGGTCAIYKCKPSYFDGDATAANGCECPIGASESQKFEQLPPHPAISIEGCANGANVGDLSDNGSNWLSDVSGQKRSIAPALDEDWFTAYGKDDTQFLSGDDYDFRVNLSGAGVVMDVYKASDSGCLLDNKVLSGGTSYSDGSDGGGDDSAYYHVRVYRPSPGCGPYTLSISNG